MQTAPSEVAIEFTEGVEPKFSAIEVHDSQGTRVDNGDTHAALDNTKKPGGEPKTAPARHL